MLVCNAAAARLLTNTAARLLACIAAAVAARLLACAAARSLAYIAAAARSLVCVTAARLLPCSSPSPQEIAILAQLHTLFCLRLLLYRVSKKKQFPSEISILAKTQNFVTRFSSIVSEMF